MIKFSKEKVYRWKARSVDGIRYMDVKEYLKGR